MRDDLGLVSAPLVLEVAVIKVDFCMISSIEDLVAAAVQLQTQRWVITCGNDLPVVGVAGGEADGVRNSARGGECDDGSDCEGLDKIVHGIVLFNTTFRLVCCNERGGY